MFTRLLATQLAGVTLGVAGTALMVNAIDKASKLHQDKKVYVFEKLPRFTGDYDNMELTSFRTMPVYEPVTVIESKPVVFDDNFAAEPFEDY